MSLGTWADSKVKKLGWTDISLIKLSTAGFVLMAAKLWEPVLCLEWYWYGLVFVLAAIKPMCRMFGNKL